MRCVGCRRGEDQRGDGVRLRLAKSERRLLRVRTHCRAGIRRLHRGPARSRARASCRHTCVSTMGRARESRSSASPGASHSSRRTASRPVWTGLREPQRERLVRPALPRPQALDRVDVRGITQQVVAADTFTPTVRPSRGSSRALPRAASVSRRSGPSSRHTRGPHAGQATGSA